MNALVLTPTAQHEPEIQAGSVEPIRKRKTNEIIGWRGRLPRSLSTPPKGCKNPESFREWATPLYTDRTEAIRILNRVIQEITTPGASARGRTFEDFAHIDMSERYQRSLQRVSHPAAAERRVQSWRNILKNWLPTLSYWQWVPSAIRFEDFQASIKQLEKTRSKHGKAPSAGLIANIAQQIRGIFKRAGVNPESVKRITLPVRKKPKVPNMTLEQQCKFFACEDIDRRDRCMAGIGMGIAVRVGELLALEASQITFTSEGRGFIRLDYGGDHHAPLKGKNEQPTRKIELHEPGLGFLKIWMRDYYKGGVRVFEGPDGGYMSKWPELWKAWTRHVGCKMHSHLMRHTYAVSMLSGSWGYQRKDLAFVKTQLGHTEIRTTEKYYASWAEGTWERDVDEMVNAGKGKAPKAKRVICTGEAFLNGTIGLSSGLSEKSKRAKKPAKTAKTEPEGVGRWSTSETALFAGKVDAKAACNRPAYQTATPVAFTGRCYAPRRRRRGIA